jgi:hypothetical protein
MDQILHNNQGRYANTHVQGRREDPSAPGLEEKGVFMQDVGQGQGAYPGSFWEENRNVAAGVILASAVAAGVIAYMLRRAREEEQVSVPVNAATRAWERAREAAGEERVESKRPVTS